MNIPELMMQVDPFGVYPEFFNLATGCLETAASQEEYGFVLCSQDYEDSYP